jgi:hypothetical protein
MKDIKQEFNVVQIVYTLVCKWKKWYLLKLFQECGEGRDGWGGKFEYDIL